LKNFIVNVLGIDKAVSWILINKIWSILRGPISIIFIIKYLSPAEQGLWYTFGSLAALTVFAELGFTVIITQFVSHEYVNVRLKSGFITGKKLYVDKLFSLIRYAIKFYLVVVPVAIIILSIAGFYFFNSEQKYIIAAWVIFSVISGVNLLVSLLQSIYQGLDKVVDMQKNIFIGSFVMSVFRWLILSFGYGIWSLIIGNGFGVILMSFLLFKKARKFWQQLIRHKNTHTFTWTHEIINLQWKYAISWASGFFIFRLYTPVLYKFESAVVAGQFGLTVSIIKMISMTSGAWIEAKIPKMNMLVARRKREELLHLFKSACFRGYIFFISISPLFIMALYLLQKYNFHSERFLEIRYALLLIFAQLAVITINFLARYLRAHKIEPYYWLSVINGILIGFLLLYLLPRIGINLCFILNVAIYWLVLLPIAIIIFLRVKKELDYEK